MSDKKNLYTIHNIDVREITTVLSKKSVDVVITSPPYFDMKDYGHSCQIGYGQKYEEYLKDMEFVFKNICNITKDTGSLWVVIDTFRKSNQVVPLPFDFANRIKEVGWKLYDVIIWNKDKTVPWSRKGQTRKIFEYVLFFVKTDKFKYHINRVRNYNPNMLKKWWIKYPERYNPSGKAPEEIWTYNIPTQGSWGNGYIRHFCPLPVEMIEKIIRLTTDEKDVVLDPFAGTGSVLAQAKYMNRRPVGFELNKKYIKMYEKYMRKTFKKGRKKYEALKKQSISQNKFQKIIIELRILKVARLIYRLLAKKDIARPQYIVVRKTENVKLLKNKLIEAEYILLFDKGVNIENIRRFLKEKIDSPPLSKFGVQIKLKFCKNKPLLKKIKIPKKKYLYSWTNTHKFISYDDSDDWFNQTGKIISPIKMEVDESLYLE